MTSEAPIDFVMLWVDERDEAWQRRKREYAATADPAKLYTNPADWEDALGNRRFRDFGTLRYALRSIERFAPWYRTLFLITEGQLPAWLQQQHPRLRVVTHAQLFRDASHLPSFNSNAIQMNLHHLPELSEQFVLFDDDKILTAPMAPEDFFVGGQPVKPAFLGCFTANTPFQTNCRRNLARVRAACGVFTPAWRRIVLAARDWRVMGFNALVLAQALLRRESIFPGGYDHMPFAFLKSRNLQIENWFDGYLEATSAHRFRELDEASPWFLNMMYYAQGWFAPGGYKSRYIFIDDFMQTAAHFTDYRRTKFESWPTYWLLSWLLRGRYKALCVQDHTTDALTARQAARITTALAEYLQQLLPAPCAFEK